MAITWGAWTSGYSNNARVGIEATVSGTTVTATYWVEFQHSVSDNQTLNRTGAITGSVNYTKSGPTAAQVSSGSFSGSRGGNYTLGANVTGVYNGASPSVSITVSIPYANPSTPGAPSISSVAATAATITSGGVSDNGGASINLWRYQYATNASFTGVVQQDHTGNSWRPTSLVRATTYWARTCVRNSAGLWSPWSGGTSFTTSLTVPGKENTPTVSEITSTSVKVTYAGNPDNGGESITANQLQVATDLSFSNLVYNEVAPNNTVVSGLSAAMTYFVRVRARNSVGWGEWSDARQFTTTATVPGQVGGLSTTNTTQDQTTATWIAPSNGGSVITGYSLQIATNSGFTTGLQTFSVNALSRTITGLEPGTTYYLRVRAINAVGNGAYSATVTVTTVSGKPTIVSSATLPTTRTNGRRGGTVYAQGWSGNFTITLQVATTSAFTIVIGQMELSPATTNADQRYDLTDDVLQANGTYYVRAKVKNNVTLYESDWSDVVSYIQTHTPSVVGLSPTGDTWTTYVASPTFRFQFLDSANPFDQMSAYQVAIENNTTGATVSDTGKTVLASTGTNPIINVTRAIAAAQKNVKLRWRVRVWDKMDQVSAWSSYHLFTLADPPVVVITSPPAGGTVDSGNPTFAITRTIPSGGQQASLTAVVREQTTNEIAWSTTVTGSGTTSVTPPTVVLQNGKTYVVTTSVTDTRGLVGSASRTFTVTYISPDNVEYNITSDPNFLRENGYVLLDWSMTDPDNEIISWGIYRRELPSAKWVLLDELFDTALQTYQDWMILGGSSYMYSVTQRANRSGVVLESPVGWRLSDGSPILEDRPQYIELDRYWLIGEDDPSLTIQLGSVREDSFTDEYESESYHVIARGRHVDYGDRIGYTGTMTLSLRGLDARQQRMAVENLRRKKARLFLRTPFGDLFRVALGNPGTSRIAGTGNVEMSDVTLPYMEVF